MYTVKTSVSTWLLLLVVISCVGLLVGTPIGAEAQNCNPALTTCQGWNGVYLGTGITNTTPAFVVDAVPYLTDSRCATGGCTICDTIALAFKDYQSIPKGVVIDARGIAGSALVCLSDMGVKRYPNPWSVLSSTYGNTVLLPAGTIYLEATWILTTYTRILGEGPGLTIIQPCTTTICGNTQAFSGTDLVDMGNSSVCPLVNNLPDCQGIVIQHLGLNGGNLSGKKGIVNSASQERSIVDDIWLLNMGPSGIGISVLGSSGNSGPYSKIYYSGNGTCASINGPQTRGIHGLTCVMTGSSPTAVLLDGINSTLEDLYISGSSTSTDGVLVGANALASSSIVFNISGNNLGNVVHISGNTSSSDVTVMGVTSSSSTNSIKDDLTSPATQITDANLGMYVIGEPLQGSGTGVIYSRFTTSLSVPSWLVGTTDPTGQSCAIGSLYSRTFGGSKTLFGCRGNSGAGSWQNIN